MEATTNIVSFVIIVFGVLQIILFFKVWGMTNNVKQMKDLMESKMKKDYQKKDYQKKENLDEPIQSGVLDNIIFDKDDFPKSAKFQKGDIVLYKTENIKLIITGYISPDAFKCTTLDGAKKTFCFQEDYLEKSDNN